MGRSHPASSKTPALQMPGAGETVGRTTRSRRSGPSIVRVSVAYSQTVSFFAAKARSPFSSCVGRPSM